MDENTKTPVDLYYTTDHSWVLVENDEGIIGITDYSQQELSEIVYIELPAPGFEVIQGSAFGTIEAMKSVAELISPVSGEVIEVNEFIEADPRLVNMDPYGDGWMIRVKLHDLEEVDGLMSAEDYIVYVMGDEESEF